MPFSFGFGGDDVEDADQQQLSQVDHQEEQLQPEQSSQLRPQKFTFAQALESLPSQVSYNTLDITGHVRVCRRALFDIRAQLMAEADIANNNDHLLAGLDKGDLTSGVYEGGFKTWECAVDLAQYVASQQFEGSWHIIELGAGSAIPSCVLLRQAAAAAPSSQKRYQLTLCDYNEAVLKLCTAPNVLLNTNHLIISQEQDQQANEQDLDLETFDAARLVSDLESKAVNVGFIAGSWGPELAELALSEQPSGSRPNLLVLASETIYAPGSLLVFVQTLQQFLNSGAPSVVILVAAKQLYFGVGGGVEEFARVAAENGLAVELVSQVPSAGVSRVILSIRRQNTSA
ncbi:hypothetical protein DV735_g2983, partial [Chaetothyriales sp. CBS 134920]